MSHHFRRKELKYLVSASQADAFINDLKPMLSYDIYCQTGEPYLVSNLYFDTQSYEIIRRSNDKPAYKAKLRLRTYANRVHFLELKQKFDGIVYKKRIPFLEEDITSFLNEGKLPKKDDYRESIIVDAIETFIKYHRALSRTIKLEYERVAYIYKNAKQLVRITIDSNLRYFDKEKNEWVKLWGEEERLLEIKVTGSVPLDIAKTLSKNRIYRNSYSKYGVYFENLIHQGAIRYV